MIEEVEAQAEARGGKRKNLEIAENFFDDFDNKTLPLK